MMGGAGARQGILSLAIKDKAALYNAYMPFVKGGGIFVPTAKRYALGDEVFILLSLMEEKDRLPVAGKVVWITPSGAQGNRAAGIGVLTASLRPQWEATVADLLTRATLTRPRDTGFLSTGKLGRHSEHLGYLLAEMQSLARAHPQATW